MLIDHEPIQIELSELSASDQFEFWQSVSSAYRVRKSRQSALDVSATIWPFPSLMFSRFAARRHRIVHDLSSRPGREFVKLRLYRRGGSCVHFDGGQAVANTGGVLMVDHSRSWSAEYSDHDQYSLFIPHALIDYRPSDHPVAQVFRKDTSTGALLRWSMESLVYRFANTSVLPKETDIMDLCRLVEIVLKEGAEGSRDTTFDFVRTNAMKAFVRSRVSEQSPRAEEIAQKFGVSRATVFRAFASEGGVRTYLMSERLKAARNELENSCAQRGALTALSQKFHFASKSHFSDAFLDFYGQRPSVYLSVTSVKEPVSSAPVPRPTNLDLMLSRATHAYGRMAG